MKLSCFVNLKTESLHYPRYGNDEQYEAFILILYLTGKTPLERAVQQRKIGTVMFLLQSDCVRDWNFMKSETIRELCRMYPPLLLFLEHEFNQPWSLLRLCRFNIRNAIQPDMLKTIPEKLLLPRTLMQYVTLNEIVNS